MANILGELGASKQCFVPEECPKTVSKQVLALIVSRKSLVFRVLHTNKIS